jgi:hypothetical protein
MWGGVITTGVHAYNMSTATSDSPNPNALGVTLSGTKRRLWVAACGAIDDDASVSAYPVNYTNGVRTASGGGANNGAMVGSARRELAADAENAGPFTLNVSQVWHATTVVIEPIK